MAKRYRITLKEAQKVARDHGMSIRKTSAGDYRISFKGEKEATVSYEDTIEDALTTAKYRFEHEVSRRLGI